MTAEIIPSILSADFAHLARDVEAVRDAGVRTVQVDVMDGRFVPNITVGMPVVEALRRTTDLRLDVHLMIESPERFVAEFAEAGADVLTVHAEATVHLHRTLATIRELGVDVGVAVNPATPLSAIEEVLHMVDVALVMTVDPGFGGQSFIPSMCSKVRRLVHRLAARGLSDRVAIQVDGGIDASTIGDVVRAGAVQCVAGSAVFAADVPVRDAVAALRDGSALGTPRAGDG